MSEFRPVKAVLLDADGVLQRRERGLVTRLIRLGGPRFTLDCIRAETGCLTGEDLLDALAPVIERHRIPSTPDEVAATWRAIRPDPAVFALVKRLRQAGVTVGIATNQTRYRGEFMRQSLGYDGLFDVHAYSYELGVAKPHAAFFTAALARLGLDPGEVLFLDDLPMNVRGARRVGLRAQWSSLFVPVIHPGRVLHRAGL